MKPEKLNLWDRIFNRYRKEVVERGKEKWFRNYTLSYDNHVFGLFGKVPDSDYTREFVIYKIIDRITGSETIEKKYLD